MWVWGVIIAAIIGYSIFGTGRAEPISGDWNMVEQPLIMLRDPESYPLSVFLSNLNTADTGIAFAAATVYMVVPMLLFLYSEEYLVEGISYSGGIK